jgi:multidrug resistance efflux pump
MGESKMDFHRGSSTEPFQEGGSVPKGSLLAVVSVTVLLGLLYFYLFASKPESATPVETAGAPVARTVAAQGKVETLPGRHVAVSSEIAARIARSFVQEGDRIEQGTLLARLESGDIEAKLKEAETDLAVAEARRVEIAAGSRGEEIARAAARLEAALSERTLAEASLARSRKLYEEGMITKASLDEKETALQTASARVREADEERRLLEAGPRPETLALQEEMVRRAEATIEYYRELLRKTALRAPISGKVIRKYLEEGEMADPEKGPVLTIADPEQIRVNAEVDETDIGKIAVGDPAEITSDAYPGMVFKGRIEEISDEVGAREVRPNNPAVNLGIKVIQVKVAFSEKTPFKIGMTVDVKMTSTPP